MSVRMYLHTCIYAPIILSFIHTNKHFSINNIYSIAVKLKVLVVLYSTEVGQYHLQINGGKEGILLSMRQVVLNTTYCYIGAYRGASTRETLSRN